MAGYHRWSTRRDDEPPNSEAQYVGRITHQPLEAANDPHGCQQCVLAPPPWSRAGMRVLAVDLDDKTTRPLDSGDDADGLTFIFKPRPLLDMRFDECCRNEAKLAYRHVWKGALQSGQRV